jgi:hypothetical protein
MLTCATAAPRRVAQRTFSADPTVMPMTMNASPMAQPIVYVVTRLYVGTVDPASGGLKVVEGKMSLFDPDDELAPTAASSLEWDAAAIGYFVLSGNLEEAL